MMLHTWVARCRGQVGKRRSRPGSDRRRALHLAPEALERRLALAAAGPVGPLATAHAAAVASRAEATAAAVAWFDDIARVVLDTTLPPRSVARTAARVAHGLSPRTAMLRVLRTPAARLAMTQQDFELLLGRPATPAELDGPHSAALRAGRQRLVLAEIAASRLSYDQAGGDATGYRAAIARDLLGGHELPATLGRLPVRTRTERRQLIGRLERTSLFERAWAARLAGMALEQGDFPARLLRIATREIDQPGGFRRALARFLGTPLSRRDVQRRAHPPVHHPSPAPVQPTSVAPALTVGPALSQYFGVNTQGLVPDPVTDPPAYGDPPAPAGSGVPMDSPWGSSVVLPEVPYATIMAGGAVQPDLQLPDSFSTTWSSALDGGLTFQTWFQAKSPGALLSEALIVNGATTQAPLIYINSAGNLAAGLFDGTSLAPNSGQTVLNWDAPVGGGSSQMIQQVGASNPVVSQVTVADNTWHHLSFVVSGQSEALYLDGLLQGQFQPSSGSYSFIPTLAAGHSASGPSVFTMGGTIMPEPDAVPYPQINYPQGFVGTIDEVAAWTTALSQSQAQEAMTTPISQDADLAAGLLAYFNFDQAPTYGAWPDQAPGRSDQAQGPTQGTLLVPITTTIPTDPFTNVPRLPGSRPWGIGVMVPLSTPKVDVGQESDNMSVVYTAALDAGDQLAFSTGNGDNGTLSVSVESDVGATASMSVTDGAMTTLRATRTGTYEITLSWAPGTSASATVTLAQIPGPLNDLMELLTSYKQNETYTWAYGGSGLASVNDQVGYDPGDVAAASYWPLWSDTTTFPVPPGTSPGTWAAELSVAYSNLVSNSPSLMNTGYANVIGVTFPSNTEIPTDIQDDLNQAYQDAYRTAPPTNGSASTPQDAVYQFLSGADTMRTTMFNVVAGTVEGTLPIWVSDYLGTINGDDNVPADVESDIIDGQADQINTVPFDLSSEPLTLTQVIEEAAASAAAGLIGAVVDIGAPLLGGLLSGAGSSIADALLGEVGAPNLSVSVKPITTIILAQEDLDQLAGNITSAMNEQWTNIQDLLNDVQFIETYLSNYGLLAAFQKINGDQLTLGTFVSSKGETVDPAQQAAQDALERISWSTMIPAVFTWEPASPDSFPTADGQTTDLSISSPINLQGPDGAWGIATGDFNGDGKLDMAVTDSYNGNSGNAVTLLAGNGDGTFTATNTKLQGNAYQPEGIVAGDFYSDGTGATDLAVADFASDDVTVLLNDGTGTFTTTNYGLNGPNNQNGPDGAIAITAGHFSPNDQADDLAVVSQSPPPSAS